VEERAKEINKLHKQIRAKIERWMRCTRYEPTRKAPLFKPCDLIWLHLWTFNVLERVNDNAYKIETSWDFRMSSTFNVGDLTRYLEDNEDFWSNLSQRRKDRVRILLSPIRSQSKDFDKVLESLLNVIARRKSLVCQRLCW